MRTRPTQNSSPLGYKPSPRSLYSKSESFGGKPKISPSISAVNRTLIIENITNNSKLLSLRGILMSIFIYLATRISCTGIMSITATQSRMIRRIRIFTYGLYITCRKSRLNLRLYYIVMPPKKSIWGISAIIFNPITMEWKIKDSPNSIYSYYST